MKKLLLLLMILFMVPNCLFAQSEPDYNPISVGNYWIQHTDSIFGGYRPTTFRIDIESTDLIGGKEYSRMKQEQSVDDGSENPSVWYVWTGQDSSGGILGAFGSSSDLNSAFIYDPPIVSFPQEVSNVGYAWEYDMLGTGSGGQHFACLIKSFSETVEVPAGTYSNCMKMSTTITDTSGAVTQIYDVYYADGVGQILNEGWSLWAGNYKYELLEYYVQASVDVKKSQNTPICFRLNQNYPNPFNPVTTISYQVQKTSMINLSIYNIEGHLIETVVNEQKSPGYYSTVWNANGLTSGLYFYRITAGGFSEVRKAFFIK